MSHLFAFIQGNALNSNAEKVYIQPGNPKKGRDVFRQKNCSACHGENNLSLKRSSLRKSLTEIVGMMWSHSNKMWAEMREMGLQIPHFDNKEMADLVAYLYFIQYYGGNPSLSEGINIFEEKGCISCHNKQAVEEKKGIDLTQVAGMTVFELISAMWNHVPEMEKMITEMNLIWPRFEKGELKNLVYYIQTLKQKVQTVKSK